MCVQIWHICTVYVYIHTCILIYDRVKGKLSGLTHHPFPNTLPRHTRKGVGRGPMIHTNIRECVLFVCVRARALVFVCVYMCVCVCAPMYTWKGVRRGPRGQGTTASCRVPAKQTRARAAPRLFRPPAPLSRHAPRAWRWGRTRRLRVCRLSEVPL